MEWSEVKQQVFALESDIVVSAGAGSGKTAALVELYLRLLAGETSLGRALEVDEIVAITFTEKAATEMRERVRAGLRQREAVATDKALWERHRRALPGACIATFHAFCSRILRENPAEAVVDPAFTLLDEASAGAELLNALDMVIEAELRAKSDGIRLLLGNFPLSGRGRGKGLREHLITLHWQRSGSAARETELLRLTEDWRSEACRRFANEAGRLGTLMEDVRRVLLGKPLQFHERLRALPDRFALAKLSPESADTTAEIAAMQSCIAGGWGKEKPLRDSLTDCLETLELCTLQLRSAPLAAALIELSARVEAAYRLAKEQRGMLDFDDLQAKTRDLLERDPELRAFYRQQFAVVMVDEYQDTNPLQKELVALLTGPGQRLFIVGDPKQSIYLFRGADVTVFTQARRETISRGGRNLFFQESFRSRQGIISFVNSFFSAVMRGGGADFEVGYSEGDHLDPQRADWDGTPCVELLATADSGGAGERRDIEAAAIANRINRLVSDLDRVRVYDRRPVTGEQRPETGDRRPETGDQRPETQDRRLESGATPDHDYQSQVKGLRSKVAAFAPRRPRFGDIAILFRRFTNLKVYERELRKAGIPYYVVKGRGFYRCQEVLDILNFLTWLEFGGDLAALAGVLRSPLCGVSDETLYLLAKLDGGIAAWENLFHQSPAPSPHSLLFDRIDPADRERLSSLARLVSRLRPLRDRLTLPELLEEILTGTDFASTLLTTFQGGQKVANLRKLIEMSRAFATSASGSLRGFVNYLTELVDAEPTEAEAMISAEGEDVVRLMTIHQSKGLEFPVVFIPELGIMPPAGNSQVVFDEGLGLGVRMAFPGSPGRPTLAWREISALARRKEAAESKRLLYVAMTRARDYLILSGEGKGEWRGWLTAFAEREDAGLVRITDSRNCSLPPGGGGPGWGGSQSAPDAEAKEEMWNPAAIATAIGRALHYAPPLPSEMIFSPTALEDYRNCPRKYFYKTVLGLDEGLFFELLGAKKSFGKGKTASEGMSALDRGNLAHRLLETLDFSALPDLQRSACERLASHLVADPADEAVAEVINSVMAFAASSLAHGFGAGRLFREYPFILKLRGKADYFIRGAMDLVAIRDGRAAVYDYKYLRREDADLEGYRFQVRTYMLALARAFPEKEIGGELLFLRGGGVEPVSCDFARFEEELLEIMEAVRERSGETEFSLRDGCDGSHCPFRQRCMTESPGLE